MSHKYNLECIVLRSINYKDTDKIYTLLSKEKGKISARAIGVRKINSKRLGSLDSLNHIIIGIAESSRGHKTITEVSYLNTFAGLKSSLNRSAYGYYATELVLKNVEEDDAYAGQLFTILLDSLTGLNTPESDALLPLCVFEYQTLKCLGYALVFDKCAQCGKLFSAKWKRFGFSLDLGGFFCDTCWSGSVTVTYSAALALNSLASNVAPPDDADFCAAAKLLHQFTSFVLGHSAKSLRLTL